MYVGISTEALSVEGRRGKKFVLRTRMLGMLRVL